MWTRASYSKRRESAILSCPARLRGSVHQERGLRNDPGAALIREDFPSRNPQGSHSTLAAIQSTNPTPTRPQTSPQAGQK